MKIIGLISSPRINGNTAKLLRETLKSAKANGAETEEIFLYDKKIEFCRGCSSCLKTGRCIIHDDFEIIKKSIIEADGLVIGSPVYGFTFNAVLRNLIERLGLLEFFTSSAFGNKYIAGVSTASGNIAVKTAKDIAGLACGGIFKRGYISGFAGIGLKGKEIDQYPAIIKKAGMLGAKLVSDINKNKKYAFQKLPDRLIKNIIIKPVLKKYILKEKDNKTAAVYNNLIEAELI